MLVAVAIAFPILLLLSVLGMERVEHRLNPSPQRPQRATAPAPLAAPAAPSPAAPPSGLMTAEPTP